MPTTLEPRRSIAPAGPASLFCHLRKQGLGDAQAAESVGVQYPTWEPEQLQREIAAGRRKYEEWSGQASEPEPPAPEADPLDEREVELRAQLERLDARRRKLALDAFSDSKAAAELGRIEAELAELERAIERVPLAREERVRRERETAETAERERIENLHRESAELDAKAAASCAPALDGAAAAFAKLVAEDWALRSAAGDRRRQAGASGMQTMLSSHGYAATLMYALNEEGVGNLIRFAEGTSPQLLAPAEDRSVTDSPKSRRRTSVKGAEHDA